MKNEIFELDAYDFYDYDAMEKLQERRSKKYMDLFRKWHRANENKNEKAKHKALVAMQVHKKQDEALKEQSCKSGYYWY